MPLTAREFDTLVRKFGFVVRESGDKLAWLTVGGNVVVRTRRSRKGSGDLPRSHAIRNQLHLTESQLRDAIRCPLSREGYLDILRQQGILSE